MKPLSIYTFIPKRNINASFYYRLIVPLDTMDRMGLPVHVIMDDNDPTIPTEQRVTAITTSDINLFYQPVSDHLLENMRRVQEFLPAKMDGAWKWAPSWVVDTDDNLFMVHPMNPAFKELGIRSPEGVALNPGDEIGYTDESTGEKRRLFKDGQDGFDLAANRRKLEVFRMLGSTADAITTSTPRSANYVREELTPKALHVFPNSIRFDHYEKVELMPHPQEIRVLWQGSPTHFEDFFPLRGALQYLTHKYPRLRWIFWGVQFPWLSQFIPHDRYQFLPWCPYEEYKLRRVMIGEDISIAPLQNHKFNQNRSAIKFYEASILHRPAATVAQNSGPYQDEIVDGETALLFDTPQQFIEQIGRLVEDETFRQQIAANAKDWVSEQRDAFKTVPKLYDFYQELRSKKREAMQPPSEAEWAAHVARLEELEKAEQLETVPQGG